MTNFDPPADPYGNERRCRICDEHLIYNYLIKDWECENPHENLIHWCRKCGRYTQDGGMGECSECLVDRR